MSEINVRLLVEKAKKYIKSAKLLLDNGDFQEARQRI